MPGPRALIDLHSLVTDVPAVVIRVNGDQTIAQKDGPLIPLSRVLTMMEVIGFADVDTDEGHEL